MLLTSLIITCPMQNSNKLLKHLNPWKQKYSEYSPKYSLISLRGTVSQEIWPSTRSWLKHNEVEKHDLQKDDLACRS